MTKPNPDVGLPPMPQANATSEPADIAAIRIANESVARSSLVAALARAQGAFTNVAFDRVNPHFRSKYASLAAILNMIRKPLADNGLCITHKREYRPAYGDVPASFILVTTLHHTSGETLDSECPLPLGVKPQELGSAETYQKRYALCSLLNIAGDEDDDANITQSSGAKITEAQTADLAAFIEEHVATLKGVTVEAYVERYLAYMSRLFKTDIKSLADIPADKFDNAKAEAVKKKT